MLSMLLQLGHIDKEQTTTIYSTRLPLLFKDSSQSNKDGLDLLVWMLSHAPDLVNHCCRDPDRQYLSGWILLHFVLFFNEIRSSNLLSS